MLRMGRQIAGRYHRLVHEVTRGQLVRGIDEDLPWSGLNDARCRYLDGMDYGYIMTVAEVC